MSDNKRVRTAIPSLLKIIFLALLLTLPGVEHSRVGGGEDRLHFVSLQGESSPYPDRNQGGIRSLYRSLSQPASGVTDPYTRERQQEQREKTPREEIEIPSPGTLETYRKSLQKRGDSPFVKEKTPPRETLEESLSREREESYLVMSSSRQKNEEPRKSSLPKEREKQREETKKRETGNAKTETGRKREPPPPSHKQKDSASKKSASSKKKALPTGFPTDLSPTPRTGYKYYSPDFYRGIYLNNSTIRKPSRYKSLLKKARKHGINTLVVDVQPHFPGMDFIRLARESDFYIVARVVVFPGGLKRYPPPGNHLEEVLSLSEKAARNGFMEIQLDYIRFADRYKGLSLTLQKRYHMISGILKMATDRLRPLGVRVGADVFGRVAFNQNDMIGQKLEHFALHLDTIYPMLYPSHFYGDPSRIANPYQTVYDGLSTSLQRTRKQTRVIAYIQGFKMSVRKSGLSYQDYIKKQIEAAEKSGSAGFIVWNASNHYNTLFRALKK